MRIRSLDHVPPMPHGGAVIFALQMLLVVLVPLLDDGRPLAPLLYVGVMITTQALTVFLLGYGRTSALIATVGGAVLAFAFVTGRITGSTRLLLWAALLSGGAATVALTVKSAFAAGVPAVQRIFCGASAYVMLGFVFAAIHGLVGYMLEGGYSLEPGVEKLRTIRWSDYVWLSFATLTTAGFGDVVSVGAVPSAVSTLEALAGVLFPATLIARIASLADADRRA